MPRIARKTAQIFGSNAGANQLGVVGSAAAGTPQYSNDPAVIQSLANYLSGWFSCVLGSNSPAMEDMNSLFFVLAYQIAYGMQLGMAEWDAATTYYKGSLAQDGAGNIYVSLIDNNLNQSMVNTANWRPISQNFGNMVTLGAAGTYNLQNYPSGTTFLVNSKLGSYLLNVPITAYNYNFTVKDIGGALGQVPYQLSYSNPAISTPNIVISNMSTIDGVVGAQYPLLTPYGSWKFFCVNGNDWFTLN